MVPEREFAALIRAYFPEVTARRVEPLRHVGWGGDSDAMLVDGALVFRFPRSAAVRRALAVEVCLLPEVAARSPLPAPRFRYIARDGAGDPLFVGYRLIPGAPLTAARFGALAGDPAAVEQAAARLGGFLAALHRLPVARAVACGVPAPAGSPRERAAARQATMRARVYPALAGDERAYLDRLFAAYLGDPRHFGWPAAVCHGDLSSDHILAPDGAQEISGIIDFGDLGVGDPAGDFVWRFEYGDAFFRRVLAHYQAPASDPEAFARVVGFRWRLMAISQIEYGLAIGSGADVAEGRAMLRARMRNFPV